MAAVMTDAYRIREARIWAQARADYLSGLSAEAVCRRHDLGLSAFRRRARKYGWRRSDQVEPPPGELDLNLYADLDMDDLARTARLRFAEAFDLAFLDPPYGKGLGEQTLARLIEGSWLKPGALVVFERGSDEPEIDTPGYQRLDARDYGAARVLFLKVAEPAA